MKLPQMGPAFLVTAAFIGPGTVISASLAGANFGFSLLWALLFSVIATIILQEMASRLGIVTQEGLGENIRLACKNKLLKVIALILTVSAIVIGNGAYQSGNILGASLGLTGIFSDIKLFSHISIWPLLIGILAFVILIMGSYKLIERALMVLVGLMSFAFIATFIISEPDLKSFFSGLFIPSIPSGASLTVIALIGTTVVPYNLFLHSSSVSKKWHSPKYLNEAKKDLYFSIPLGGLISIAIVSTAASAFFGKNISINNAADLAPALKPIFGDFSSIFIAVGLFSAGISSAITAPLAAAFALTGILNLSKDLNSYSFKLIWLSILLIGVIVSSLGYKPISIIWFAQIANGILLPLVSIFLLWIMNTDKLGEYKNNKLQNILGGIVVMITLLLSTRSLMSAFGML
ncbi:Nramp family divalent metal transporter [Pseudoalteromonas denitrificans]|uniref:NRAMP (Natural resistance-associated macrophage protein) metal ion transporters n=1 Tax=Pseudoalteromonas denitrificans DSM 6059 TaxID=1123010 RepID=A0A1I1NXI0_9GAMM|nr:Nramp family divalent metal transporter [Pseudoalteromonas denitrificans]SFD02052.1 NRAMP (natural resistance-associated macrophage protein) metal ion transporters [Pseudoalteromonas denitrificans DSM 6059]